MNDGRVLEWFKRAKAFENYKKCDNSGEGICPEFEEGELYTGEEEG